MGGTPPKPPLRAPARDSDDFWRIFTHCVHKFRQRVPRGACWSALQGFGYTNRVLRFCEALSPSPRGGGRGASSRRSRQLFTIHSSLFTKSNQRQLTANNYFKWGHAPCAEFFGFEKPLVLTPALTQPCPASA